MIMTKLRSALQLALLLSVVSQTVIAHQHKQKITFKTDDNQTIVAWFQQPVPMEEPHPVIILIHQGGASKDEWVNLPLWHKLTQAGYALLAYDIRQHGESSADRDDIFDLFNNPVRAPLDLKAAITFVQSKTTIDSSRIGINGASVGANLAVMASALSEYPIRSAVALSGKTDAAKNLANISGSIQAHTLFTIASEGEQGGLRKKWAESFYQSAKRPKKLEITSGSAHGSAILTEHPSLNNEIIQWFEQTLK